MEWVNDSTFVLHCAVLGCPFSIFLKMYSVIHYYINDCNLQTSVKFSSNKGENSFCTQREKIWLIRLRVFFRHWGSFLQTTEEVFFRHWGSFLKTTEEIFFRHWGSFLKTTEEVFFRQETKFSLDSKRSFIQTTEEIFLRQPSKFSCDTEEVFLLRGLVLVLVLVLLVLQGLPDGGHEAVLVLHDHLASSFKKLIVIIDR